MIHVEQTQVRKETAAGIMYTQPGAFTGHVMLLIMFLMSVRSPLDDLEMELTVDGDVGTRLLIKRSGHSALRLSGTHITSCVSLPFPVKDSI